MGVTRIFLFDLRWVPFFSFIFSPWISAAWSMERSIFFLSQIPSLQKSVGVFPLTSQGSGPAHQELCHASFRCGKIAFEASKCSYIVNNSQHFIKLIQLAIKSDHGYSWSKPETFVYKHCLYFHLFLLKRKKSQKLRNVLEDGIAKAFSFR